MYGGNTSGKTNFFKALNFARTLIVKGTQPDSPIPVETFRLDNTSDTRLRSPLSVNGKPFAFVPTAQLVTRHSSPRAAHPVTGHRSPVTCHCAKRIRLICGQQEKIISSSE
ncbi:hypothetical protein [Pelodictyon luteolum]|uniref:hypothetical protein n=1 Tax=Pelodictyon luteolum TaxID=1100 RepID=UPI003B82EB5B